MDYVCNLCRSSAAAVLFHPQIATCIENVKFRAVNVVELTLAVNHSVYCLELWK